MIAHAQSSHRYSVRVYYQDTDAGGVVYHANYLRYAEQARTEALREAGIPHARLVERFGLMLMVRRAEIDYLRPALLDDRLVVETETTDVGGATILLRQTVHGPAGVCATLRIKLACVRIAENRAARIPPEWRDVLTAMRSDRAAFFLPRESRQATTLSAGTASGSEHGEETIPGAIVDHDLGKDTERED